MEKRKNISEMKLGKKCNSLAELNELTKKSKKDNHKLEQRLMTFKNTHKYVMRFYGKFTGNPKEIPNDTGLQIYEADSPFGPGKLIFSGLGGWYDESTDEMGSMEHFLKKMFPILTNSEALRGVSSEYFNYVCPPHLKKDNYDLHLRAELLRQLMIMAVYLNKQGLRQF